MKVTSAEFVKSAVEPSQYPDSPYPEVAFAGRSNAGKSSLINALVNRRKLAQTSTTPGKTRLLNFFVVNRRLSFVDLPGYGFANVSRSLRSAWRPMVEDYLRQRKNLCLVVLVLDVRRGVSEEDIALAGWLRRHDRDFLVVLTKSDKVSKEEAKRRLADAAEVLGLSGDQVLLFSAVKGLGKEELWREMGKKITFAKLA
ncbi:MAG TPA: ribosome biogenesis GTP-binding protein YihA/YsxC [Syntrophales bacterium]|nr:YihA family ribosome biogenesis GTP-binding protein [Syntrophobacterales bacterium]HRR41654.1 ribosome biogenesis GTP-binding protein YihA/YsxC [Syntrophales bacterium]HRT26750.1 ribosome biogenesis GTP-binding protein YihA/YsxC [Syntrophales bacterium]HRT70690.1 ribosome biogenesis GTP-binding protein YihA/YsxC [Syntrophales bacterium]